MSKKRAKKHFRVLIFLFFVLGSNTLTAQQSKEAKDCKWMAAGKRMSLFSPLPILRKNLLVSRDIEDLDTLVFLYWYDDKIININNYTFTPQLMFYVDTARKETIRQKFYYNIQREKEDGGAAKKDLNYFFKLIKARNIPFLQFPGDPSFGSTYRFRSECYSYRIDISKVSDVPYDKSQQEFTISVSMAKYANAKK